MIKAFILTISLLMSSTSLAHEPCQDTLRPIGGYYTSHGWVPVTWIPTGHCHTSRVTYRPTYPHPHTHYVPPRPLRPAIRIILHPRPRPRPHPHRH